VQRCQLKKKNSICFSSLLPRYPNGSGRPKGNKPQQKKNHIMNSCEMSVIPAQCCAQPNVHSTQQAAANALLF
jgi:hypothetical protein